MILIVLLFVFCSGRGQKRWSNIQSSRLTFSEGLERTGENYGVMNEGPALTLQAGSYTISWDIETDGANAILLTSTNNAAITPQRIELTPGQNCGSATICAIDQIYNLQILVSYESGSYLNVKRIDFSGDANTDRLFLCAFILAAAAILNVLRVRGWLTARRRGELVLLAFVVLIASIPVLKENLNSGHDSSFHIDRLLNMLNALRSGQFPARLGAYMQNQYGAVTSAYYPELFLYIPAAMMLANASLNFSMHVFFILITLTTALVMRYSAGKLFKDENAGMLASILYTLSAYRLTDMYTRFSVGEALAMAFIPLFVYALYEVVLGDKRRWKLLALSGMAIYQSHLISAFLCGLAAVAVCALFIVRIIKEKRFIPLLLAAACALGLCLYALIPLYTNSLSGVSTSMMPRWTTGHLLAPAQLFLSADIIEADPSDGTLKSFALVIGLPLLLSAAAALHSAVAGERRSHEDRLSLFLLVVGAGFALMTTTLFPWARLQEMAGSWVAYIQFPWRLLMVTALCFSLAGGYGLSRMAKAQPEAMQFAVFALCAAMVLPMLSAETRKEGYIEAGDIPAWDQLYEDYTLSGTVVSETKDQSVHTEGDVAITDYEKFGTQITAHIESAGGGEISFPLFAFEGYEATIDGKAAEILRGENNRIALTIPAQTSGELLIRFAGKPVWRLGEAVSLLTALAMIADTLFRKKRALSAASIKQR